MLATDDKEDKEEDANETVRRKYISATRMAQQYLIVDLVSLVAIPAQVYSTKAFYPEYLQQTGIDVNIVSSR